jgi:hypothetical protein
LTFPCNEVALPNKKIFAAHINLQGVSYFINLLEYQVCVVATRDLCLFSIDNGNKVLPPTSLVRYTYVCLLNKWKQLCKLYYDEN